MFRRKEHPLYYRYSFVINQVKLKQVKIVAFAGFLLIYFKTQLISLFQNIGFNIWTSNLSISFLFALSPLSLFLSLTLSLERISNCTLDFVHLLSRFGISPKFARYNQFHTEHFIHFPLAGVFHISAISHIKFADKIIKIVDTVSNMFGTIVPIVYYHVNDTPFKVLFIAGDCARVVACCFHYKLYPRFRAYKRPGCFELFLWCNWSVNDKNKRNINFDYNDSEILVVLFCYNSKKLVCLVYA